MSKKTRTERAAEIASDLRDVIADLDTLKEEVESQRDNMQGTNLENTQKYSTLDGDKRVCNLDDCPPMYPFDMFCRHPEARP